MLFIFRKHFASSANKDNIEFSVGLQSDTSFMKRNNINEPSVDPSGTPDVTGTHSDVEPSSTPLWDRFFLSNRNPKS